MGVSNPIHPRGCMTDGLKSVMLQFKQNGDLKRVDLEVKYFFIKKKL